MFSLKVEEPFETVLVVQVPSMEHQCQLNPAPYKMQNKTESLLIPNRNVD